jgi:hypothetical protein
MRSKFTLLGLTIFILATAACKKCLVCQQINKSTTAVVYEFPKTCGNKTSLTSQELNYRANTPDSLELKCERIKEE